MPKLKKNIKNSYSLFYQLPISVDIVKHPKELDGKSTAVHAALLAPDNVRIYTYPVLPNYIKEKMVSTVAL